MDTRSIGIFDSGVGGLTVMRAIVQQLPKENIAYFADTAHFPLGEKSPEDICRYTLESASFLLRKGVKLLVLACHTASCYAFKTLKEQLPIPILGIIDSSVAELERLCSAPTALLATTSTIQSGLYQSLFPHLISIACPRFVPLIEQNLPLDDLSCAYLTPLIENQIPNVFLACTHYPLILPQLQKLLGPQTHLVDPALSFAQLIKKTLSSLNLLNNQTSSPRHELYTSGSVPPSFDFFLQRLEQKLEIVK